MNDQNIYIGQINWFGDNLKNGKYGFIFNIELGEVFFHQKNILINQDQKFIPFENNLVVFNAIKSSKIEGKFEAINICLLEKNLDKLLLLNYFFTNLINSRPKDDYLKLINSLKLFISQNVIQEDWYSILKEFMISNIISLEDFDFINNIMNMNKRYMPDQQIIFQEFINSRVSNEIKYKLWLNGNLNDAPINYIAELLLRSESEIQTKIFSKSTEDEKNNFIYCLIHDLELTQKNKQMNHIRIIIHFAKKYTPNKYSDILDCLHAYLPEYIRLILWLDDLIDELDFEKYKDYVVTLSSDQQKRFVKKVMKYVHEKKTDIKLKDLTALNVMDYNTNKFFLENNYPIIDYSTSIILNVLSDLDEKIDIKLSKNQKLLKTKIYDLIIRQLQSPNDILEINGFFDKCKGRSSVYIKAVSNSNGEVITNKPVYTRHESSKPKNHTICDGRKVLGNKTERNLLTKDNLDYWWCANQKCYESSRALHSSDNWENYSLLDFLNIFSIDYNLESLEIYLNLINKVNIFLNHLKCRECEKILYPKGKSSFAFYGVNNFECQTETCTQNSKLVYITHCLNGYCEMVIDSRDCVKCKPSGYDSESCGWYVCNNCHSCCSSKNLNDRKYVHENILKTEYKCHSVGHLELGVVSCNKCGDSMNEREINIEDYNRILNWLKDPIANRNFVVKSGINNEGKNWFLVRNNKYSSSDFQNILKTYSDLGFFIPDLTLNKPKQLVVEGNNTIINPNLLDCKSCGHVVDLSFDNEKRIIMKRSNSSKNSKNSVTTTGFSL